MDLNTVSCRTLTGVGPRIAECLTRINIETIQDLLFHLPARYQDRTRIHAISTLSAGDHALIEGEIVDITRPPVGRTKLLCQLRDETGTLHVRFFFMNALQGKPLQVGMRLRAFGEVQQRINGSEMIHPECSITEPGSPLIIDQHLTPIYPTTEGLSQLTLRKLTKQALQHLEKGALLEELLPASLLEKLHLPTLKEALLFVHRPPPNTSIDILLTRKHSAQTRLGLEELLAHRLALHCLKKSFQAHLANPFLKPNLLSNTLLKSLPFQLTTAQKRVSDEITQDLKKPYPMLRLVQGDVGSGKTIVAATAMLSAVNEGYQAALLAPTQLLVDQHYRTFKSWMVSLGVNVVMLSGHMKSSDKQKTLRQIENGEAHIIIGTQAIFQAGVTFSNLALMVVDEQHRFGVAQRAYLREKGKQGNYFPHQLVMTATPIPRTLAMSLYADLDYSIIDELPPGRLPIVTRVMDNAHRDDILNRIREIAQSGRQAYWVCTLIEESDVLQCEAAEKKAEALKNALPEIRVALLHGRMNSLTKESIMQSFKNNEIQLLVATTVIEVGVDVPNASIMIIENAERLGLAQLHQLRGRIGRGTTMSYCLLMYQAPLSRLAKERLHILRETTDGFKIAERDLLLRGAGEVLGTQQTGDVSLRVADFIRDTHLFPKVTDAAHDITEHHPEKIQPLISRWLKNTEKYGQV